MSIDLVDSFMGIFGLSRVEPDTVTTLKRHLVGEPIPKGWVLVNDMQTNHHGEYCVLIKKM